MTQNEMILDALLRGPLTPMEALERLGVFRLAARVGELRERGYPIAVERCELPNGKKVARYFMGRAA
jgi:hypothetical protein